MGALFRKLWDRLGSSAFITADGIETGSKAGLRSIGEEEWVQKRRQCLLQGGTLWWHVSLQNAERCGRWTSRGQF
jgi:hypothetical protein